MSRTLDKVLARGVTGTALVFRLTHTLNVPDSFLPARNFRVLRLLMMPPLPFLTRPASVACQTCLPTAIPALHRSATSDPDHTRPVEQAQESTYGTRIPPGRDGS